jgi:thioredoxin 1
MASKNVRVLNELDFDQVISTATVPVLVEFSAPAWCPPCKVQSAILERVAEGAQGVLVATIDIDECPDIASRFGVRGVPTLVVLHRGKETARRLGLTNEAGVRMLVRGPQVVASATG